MPRWVSPTPKKPESMVQLLMVVVWITPPPVVGSDNIVNEVPYLTPEMNLWL
jgi:hypothetical protein